jgi:hypothetical protein
MFPQQPQQQFRTAGADVKIFYGNGGVANSNQFSWNKPIGVSHVYMMLIGAGGNGDGAGTGGGSGAVTVWYGSAQNVPDSLIVVTGRGGANIPATVTARFSNSALTPTAILIANASNSTSAGAAMTANQFTASGFFQSVAGQDGSAGSIAASTTSFLTGGGQFGGSANYGYSTLSTGGGFFMLQPMIVGLGSGGTNNGSVGGGGGGGGGSGGPGMVLIASW